MPFDSDMHVSGNNGKTEQEGTGKYIIQIDNFEGPLDLLWNLIKQARIEITEVSISSITEQYIEYLKLMESLNVQVASDFILMASELLYYKSKALLPGDDLQDEYFVPPLPPELIQKLLEYKKYQQASRSLREMFEIQVDAFPRENIIKDLIQEEDLVDVTLYDLLHAFARVMDSAVTVEQKEIIFDEILVSDRIIHVTELLRDRDQITFSDIFTERPARALVIATFLAILEMAKTGRLRLMQHRVFGEIRLFKSITP